MQQERQLSTTNKYKPDEPQGLFCSLYEGKMCSNAKLDTRFFIRKKFTRK